MDLLLNLEDRNYNVATALENLRPGTSWIVEGNTYDGIIWKSNASTKPSRQEVEDEIIRLKNKWDNDRYSRLRAKEYPPITDYLDAVVKGDQEQMQAYVDACLAVKAKYPKPE